MLSALKHHLKNAPCVLKYLLDKLPSPPEFTTYHAPMLALAAIHATVLAIVVGVFSTYGFYRHSIRDQLKMKLYQEANEINNIRFDMRYIADIPEQVLNEAKKLFASTTSRERVKNLENIIREGKNVNLNLLPSIYGEPEEVVAAQGRKAFHLMFAIVFYYPFPEAIDSRSVPRRVSLRDIATIQSWASELDDVTIPLIKAYEYARDGLHNVLIVYARFFKDKEPYASISYSSDDPFFKFVYSAGEIGRRVTEQLAAIERHDKSGIGTLWVALGFLGASVTFVCSVLIPLLNPSNPIIRKVVFWEPMAFYVVALVGIGLLISIPIAFCTAVLFILIGYFIFK